MKHGGPAKSVDVVARGTGSGLGRGTSSLARHLKLAPLAQLQLDVQSHIDCLGGGRRHHLLLQSHKREWHLGLWQDLVSVGDLELFSYLIMPCIFIFEDKASRECFVTRLTRFIPALRFDMLLIF